jgi:hypothetical protein
VDSSSISIFPEDLFLDEIYSKEFPIKFQRSQRTIYLYFPSGSEKEDWFKALAQATGTLPAHPKHSQELFMSHLVKLFKNSKESQKTELTWINALIGIFFIRFRESDSLKRLIFARFERMLPLLPLPFFVNNVRLEEFSLGDAGFPVLLNGCLHTLSKEGEYIASFDLNYELGISFSVACKLNFDFTGFSSLWFDTCLTVKVIKLSGRIQLRIKSPLSDRIWVGFEKKPLMKFDIQPSVSARALKWQIVSGMIERQIQDSLTDMLVLPNTIDIVVPPLILGEVYTAPKPFPDKDIPLTFSASVLASKDKEKIPFRNRTKSEGDIEPKNIDPCEEDENLATPPYIRHRQRHKMASFSNI